MMTIALSLLRQFWPYLIAVGIGFSAAWGIQGLRVTHAQQELEGYKIEQQRLKNEADEAQRKRQEETANDYRKNVEKLKADNQAFKRCVAAGKCGGMQYLPGCTGIRLSASGGANEASSDTVSAAGESAPPVITECAATTLQLNALQADIEKQGGH